MLLLEDIDSDIQVLQSNVAMWTYCVEDEFEGELEVFRHGRWLRGVRLRRVFRGYDRPLGRRQ